MRFGRTAKKQAKSIFNDPADKKPIQMKRHLPFAPKSLPRICFGALIFAECIAAFASSPIPSELRKWIEDQNPNDKTPADERIFVDDMRKESAIVCYHKGMTLQDVLDQVKTNPTPWIEGNLSLIDPSQPAGKGDDIKWKNGHWKLDLFFTGPTSRPPIDSEFRIYTFWYCPIFMRPY